MALNGQKHAPRDRIARWCGRFLLALTIVLGCAGAPARALDEAAGGPKTTVTAFDTALQHAMRDAKKLGYQGRYDLLAPAMQRAFDFPAMTRIATGSAWAKMTPEQQKALADAFARFSIATYANQFNDYDGEQFAVTEQKESPQGMVVATVMKPAKGDAVRFNYLLHQAGDGWKIIDIYLDGSISQLAVRRGEFSAVLARSGPDGLLHLLESRIKALAGS